MGGASGHLASRIATAVSAIMNFKFIATQFGESIKYDTTINEVGRVFSSLTELKLEDHPNDSITSGRSQLIYSWVMTICDSSLSESEKTVIIRQAIFSLIANEGIRQRLLTLTKSDVAMKTNSKTYVHESRIAELRSIGSSNFDLSRLIRFCEELNIVFSNECYLSAAMIVRAIMDHIPPIFGKNSFTEVANNHGSKSFKDSMRYLDNSSRKISDSHLHTQIRKSEVLPNSNQVDFSNDLDVLLAEIYRYLK